MGSICNGSWGTTVQHARESLPFRHGNTSVFKGLKQTSPSNPPRSPSWREMQLKMDREIVSTIHRCAVTQGWVLATIKAKAGGGGTDPAPPDVTLQEEAAVPKVGRASQAAGHLPILLHDLDHLTHGCTGTQGAVVCYVIMHTKMQCFTPFPIWITNRSFKTAPSDTHHLCTLRSTVRAHN